MSLHLQANMPQHSIRQNKYSKGVTINQDPVVVSQQTDVKGLQKNEQNTNSSLSNNSSSGVNQRQQGVVEKLLHSYGFIESDVQKEGHLFFHYSEFVGDLNTVSVGDTVEFNLSYDYRSSRWLAVSVTKVEAALTVSKTQFSGLILVKASPQEKFTNTLDRSGRISYEESGECFYIPYSTLDLDDEKRAPDATDKVTFFIATDKKTGHMWATCVKKLEPPPKCQGVICSLKENFGFIERADAVKEIFFHYSEYSGNIVELVLGDDVEFVIQTRNNKEVATQVTRLPEGTVIFEDVSSEKKRGKIGKVIKATRKHADPLAGCIVYETVDGPNEIPYSERDISGEFTLFVGDIVDFQIAKDRRDGLLHATTVVLCEESFVLSKEKRDKGVVTSVKESYGFLQLLTAESGTSVGEAQLFFHFNELYETTTAPVVVGDEIEFTVAYDPANKSKPIAIRIRKLSKGTIKQEQVISQQTYTGTVIQDQPIKSKKGNDAGIIRVSGSGEQEATILYYIKDADLKYGDKISFNICESTRTSDSQNKKAVNIKLISRLGAQTGFVCSLKDSYGFLETIPIDDEIFFHYSCYQGDVDGIEVGDVMEYVLVCRNKKISAENVKKASQNKVSMEMESVIQIGRVTRAIRNNSTAEREVYSGLIQAEPAGQGEPAVSYPFGIVSLVNKRTPPSVGTVLEFQVARVKDSVDRAVNIVSAKDLVTGKIDSIKGHYGFIEVEDREKKVYFSMNDVKESVSVGETVQFVILPVNGSNRVSAVCIRKTKQTARPDRLISKLKTQMSIAEGPKVIIIRQPRRPDEKSNGFAPRATKSNSEPSINQ